MNSPPQGGNKKESPHVARKESKGGVKLNGEERKDGQREFGVTQSMSRKGNCLDDAKKVG